jgi:L-threonate 2-dehydrogenase
MGAGLARVLTQHGITVLTSLEGRSAASAARARDAGMAVTSLTDLTSADIFMAVLPPGGALSFARRFANVLSSTQHKPLYVDCNAVSPATLQHIQDAVTPSGAPFADIGIIGLPPGATAPPPRLYAAGAGKEALLGLTTYGLDVRWLEGAAGTASALKMSYGGITKGLIAVASALILGATRAGVAQSLAREMAASESQLLASLSKRIPDMLPKAYRWVAEMQEISNFLGADPGASTLYQGAARFYQGIAAQSATDPSLSDAFSHFFEASRDDVTGNRSSD